MTTPCSSKLIIPIISGSLLLLANSTAKAADAYLSYYYEGNASTDGLNNHIDSSAPGHSVTIYSNTTQHITDSVSKTNTEDFNGSGNDPDYSGPTSSTQVAQAAINGSFDFNHLSGYASSSASKSVGHYTWTDNNPNSIFYGTNQGDNTHSSAGANSYIQEYINDVLTITSTELQSGTAVELVVDWSLEASFGVTGYPASLNPYGISGTEPSAQLYIGSGNHTLDYWNNGTNASLSGSYTLYTSVGDVTGFGAELAIASGHMTAYQEMFNFETQTTEFTGQNVSSFADANAKFAIRVLTPGASYSAASGNVYATSLTAVPVPSAAWLFASGLLGLFGLKHQRQA